MKVILGFVGVLVLMLGMVQVQDVLFLIVQFKWVMQVQFDGYYVVQDKGFYEEEGLNVIIKFGGFDIVLVQVLVGGGVDVVVEWMFVVLVVCEKGLVIVNIVQFFKKFGMMLICCKEIGIILFVDFKGKMLGVWFFGNEYLFLFWMNMLGLKIDGGFEGVMVLKQGFNVDFLLQKQVDCISIMIYNEYGQVLDVGLLFEDLVMFKYDE